MDENINMNDIDYTEEMDGMYSTMNNLNKKRIVATATTVVAAIGATGLIVKGRKKIAKVVRKVEHKHLKNRKRILNKELVNIEAKLNRYSNDNSED